MGPNAWNEGKCATLKYYVPGCISHACTVSFPWLHPQLFYSIMDKGMVEYNRKSVYTCTYIHIHIQKKNSYFFFLAQQIVEVSLC